MQKEGIGTSSQTFRKSFDQTLFFIKETGAKEIKKQKERKNVSQ